MITGTGTNNSFLQLFFRQAAHHIIGATQFIGTYNLQIFSFQINIALVFAGKIMIKL